MHIYIYNVYTESRVHKSRKVLTQSMIIPHTVQCIEQQWPSVQHYDHGVQTLPYVCICLFLSQTAGKLTGEGRGERRGGGCNIESLYMLHVQ